MLRRLSVILQLACRLIDCITDFTLENLGQYFALWSRFKILALVTRVGTILVPSLSRIVNTPVVRLVRSLLSGILHACFAVPLTLVCNVFAVACSLLTLRFSRLLLTSLVWLIDVACVVDMLSKMAIIHESLATDFT